MKTPKPTIKNVRKGKIAIKYAGDLELLRKVLGIAFPKDPPNKYFTGVDYYFLGKTKGFYACSMEKDMDLPSFTESEIILNERIWNTEDLSSGDVQLFLPDGYNDNAKKLFSETDVKSNVHQKYFKYFKANKGGHLCMDVSKFSCCPIATESEVLTKAEFSEKFIGAVIGKSFKIKNKHQAKWLLEMVKKWISGLSWVEITEDRINNMVRSESVAIYETSYDSNFIDKARHSFSTLKPFGYVKPKNVKVDFHIDENGNIDSENAQVTQTSPGVYEVVIHPSLESAALRFLDCHLNFTKQKSDPNNHINDAKRYCSIPVIQDGKQSMAFVQDFGDKTVTVETNISFEDKIDYVPESVLIFKNAMGHFFLLNERHYLGLRYRENSTTWLAAVGHYSIENHNTGKNFKYTESTFLNININQVFKSGSNHYIKTNPKEAVYWRNDNMPGKHIFNAWDAVKLLSEI